MYFNGYFLSLVFASVATHCTIHASIEFVGSFSPAKILKVIHLFVQRWATLPCDMSPGCTHWVPSHSMLRPKSVSNGDATPTRWPKRRHCPILSVWLDPRPRFSLVCRVLGPSWRLNLFSLGLGLWLVLLVWHLLRCNQDGINSIGPFSQSESSR